MQHQTTFKTSPLPRCFSAMEPSIPALAWMAWKIEEDGTARSPNIYTVIKIFKDTQNAEDILRIQRRAGGTVRPPSKKYATIKTRLQTLKERYQNGIIDLMTFHQKYYIWDKDLVTVTDKAFKQESALLVKNNNFKKFIKLCMLQI